MASYTSNDIQTLQFPENIRAVPGMYIGAVDADGYWLILRECLDNGLDEYLAGRNKGVALVEDQDGSFWIYDQGAGIPQGTKILNLHVNGKLVQSKMPTMQAIFSQLHTSGKYHSEAYKVSVGCFTGNTKIKLLNGKEVTFTALYKRWQKDQTPIDIWTWDVKKDQATFSKISHVQLTKYTDELVEITLNTGKKIRCTPNHPFYIRTIRGIKKVPAERLTSDMSLVSMHVEYDECGYTRCNELVRNNAFKDKSLHRAVYAMHFGYDSIKGKVVHHKDRNPANNCISNLIALTVKEHNIEHQKDKQYYGKYYASLNANKELHSKIMIDLNKDSHLNFERVASRIVYSIARLILRNLEINEHNYNQERLSGAPAWSVVSTYLSLEDAISRAKAYCAYLKSIDHTVFGKKKSAQLIQPSVTAAQNATRASYDAMVALWNKDLKKCIDNGYALDEITEDIFLKCSSSKTVQKYSKLDRLNQWTTFDEFKQAYKENRKVRFFKDLSKDARKVRLEKSSLSSLSTEKLNRIIRLFVLACRKAKSFSRESYESSRSCAHPNWTRGLEAIKLANNCKSEDEVKEFVDNYNYQIVKIKKIKLKKPVPVYDLTVDGTHTFFVEEVLVSNSHGIGVKASNALSEYFEVFTRFKNQWYTIGFKKGNLSQPVKSCAAPKFLGKTLLKGTLIHLKHDKSIFKKDVRLDFEKAKSWAEITSYLNPGFSVIIKDKEGNSFKYVSKEGPKEFVTKTLEKLKAQAEPEVFEFKNELADVLVSFSNAEGNNIHGYTNGLYNSDGGKHVDSVSSALYLACKQFAKAKQTVSAYDFKEGLVGIVNMHLHKAEFSSQDKLKLTDNRAGADFQKMLETAAIAFFKKNKVLAQKLCEKASKLSELRSQFKASKKMISAINAAKKKGMPAKYAPYSANSKLEDRELLIVEGLSAAGGLRQVRNSNQALYPIKGKITNLIKNKDKGLESEEVINILSAIGYDPKSENPMSKLQVGRVICLADADDDGPLAPNTKVLLCNGTVKTIYQLAKQWEKTKQPIWVWSLDANGDLHPAQAIKPRITCYKDKYAVVHFDDGTKIKCTLNHKFAVNSASTSKIIEDIHGIKFVAAKDLQPEDSIMSSYFFDAPLNGNAGNTTEYKYIKSATKKFSNGRKYFPLHRLVAKEIYPAEYADYERKNKINKNWMSIHHKVVKVEIKKLDEPKPFYCLTVPKYGNFLLADKNGNGICSSNCHINTLLLTLFYKVLPEMFEKGMIYVADMPEFYTTYKNTIITGQSISEIKTKLLELGHKPTANDTYYHLKGWGELENSLMKVLAVDKATRKLIRIKPITDHDNVTFVRIMNEDVAYRRQMLGLSDDV